MTHYIIGAWATKYWEEAFKDLMKNCQGHSKLDKKLIKKYNLCTCYKDRRIFLRELKFYEIIVSDLEHRDFERKFLYQFVERPLLPDWFFIRKIIQFLINKLTPFHKVSIPQTKGTSNWNNRSFMLFKVQAEYDKKMKMHKCQKCKKNIPQEWL